MQYLFFKHALGQFNDILQKVGIENTIRNIFSFNTKREIVDQVKDTEAFRRCYSDTISCSHPVLQGIIKMAQRNIQ